MADGETYDAFVESLFKRVPDSVAESFSEDQLRALKIAFARSRHSVDIRRSLSLFGKGYYFVLLMGTERRPRERLNAERTTHPAWTIGNIIVFVFLGTLLAHALVQILQSLGRLFGG